MSIETSNTSFESTQNKQQYDTKMTGRGKKKVVVIRNVLKDLVYIFVVDTH